MTKKIFRNSKILHFFGVKSEIYQYTCINEFSGIYENIHPSLHQKQLISLVALLPVQSSLNSRTAIGDNLDYCQKDDLNTDQLKLPMNL